MNTETEMGATKSGFQVRIACIIPTCFRCTIGNLPQEDWELENRKKGEFVDAVKWQMAELAKCWRKATGSWLQLLPEPEPCLVETPITHLGLKDTSGGKERKLQIAEPRPKDILKGSGCADAMLYFWWLPYRDDVYKKLKCEKEPWVEGHWDKHNGNRKHKHKHFIWMPSNIGEEICRRSRKEQRGGPNHEFKHALVHLLGEARADVSKLKKLDPVPREKLIELLNKQETREALIEKFSS